VTRDEGREGGSGGAADGSGGAGDARGADGDRAAAAPLGRWLLEHGLLRGPFPFADYWASVLRIGGGIPDRLVESGLVDPSLYRLGLDRPDLQVPRLRSYLALFLLGPILLLLRRFRRLGRYRAAVGSEAGREVLDRLERLRLELAGEGPRVDVRKGNTLLAEDLVDPLRVSGFASFFFATYELPLASFSAILLAAVSVPVLHALDLYRPALDLWIPAGFPALALVLYLVYRDLVTAVLGALPVVIARYLLPFVRHGTSSGWPAFLGGLAGLFVLYLLIDWFFMPRPVPPVLLLYTKEGPARPYDRREDAPWWLEGEVYWVWRYLALTPAELNKFWERDWERVELWIRADGPEAGHLEWVVTDGHYRELWIPAARLSGREGRDREAARRAAGAGGAGTWVVEVDADLIFHAPGIRAATFSPEEEGVPTRSLRHLAALFWRRPPRDDPDEVLRRLREVRLELGGSLFEDAPEVAAPLIARHLLSVPWRYWRYPLGAATREEDRLYGTRTPGRSPPAADPDLQIKAPRPSRPGDAPDLR